MKKNLFLIFSVFVSILFFSCSESSSSSISFSLPNSVFKSLNKSESENLVYNLKINLSGDYAKEYSFTFSNEKTPSVYTIDNLPVGAKVEINAKLLLDDVVYYASKESASVTLESGKNSANLKLVRLYSDVSIDLADFEIQMTYSKDKNIITYDKNTESISISLVDTDVSFGLVTDFNGEATYKWLLNGTELESTTDSCKVNFTENASVLVDEKNTISCIITSGGVQKIAELSFEVKSSES